MIKILFLVLFFSFTGQSADNKLPIIIGKSRIHWTGEKVVGSHQGTLRFDRGEVVIDDQKIKSGEFIVDMNSLEVSDLEAGKGKEDLEYHLKSMDFFDVKNHRYALLKIKKILSDGQALVELKIKGISKQMKVPFEKKGKKIISRFEIDRTLFEIEYGSEKFFKKLGDKMIKDKFKIDVEVAF